MLFHSPLFHFIVFPIICLYSIIYDGISKLLCQCLTVMFSAAWCIRSNHLLYFIFGAIYYVTHMSFLSCTGKLIQFSICLLSASVAIRKSDSGRGWKNVLKMARVWYLRANLKCDLLCLIGHLFLPISWSWILCQFNTYFLLIFGVFSGKYYFASILVNFENWSKREA